MGINDLTDETDLLCKLRDGDERAFEILYNTYKFRIAGRLFRLLKSEELVKDTLQALFFKIWETRTQIDPEKSFRSYLFRIAENLVIDSFRQAAKNRKLLNKMMVDYNDGYSVIEEDILRRENHEMLLNAIDLMPAQRKKVFTLCKLEGKSYKEVKEIMGINEKTISSHMLQANRFLRAYFSYPKNIHLYFLLFILKDL
jgi:RNA polymerase sigma-70 factor (ECF subfamily)